MKNDEKKTLICFWLSYVVFMSSAWKNVGMTISFWESEFCQGFEWMFFCLVFFIKGETKQKHNFLKSKNVETMQILNLKVSCGYQYLYK